VAALESPAFIKARCSCGAPIVALRMADSQLDITFECGHRHEVYVIKPLRQDIRLETMNLSPCPKEAVRTA
jgi:hypothetical protein